MLRIIIQISHAHKELVGTVIGTVSEEPENWLHNEDVDTRWFNQKAEGHDSKPRQREFQEPSTPRAPRRGRRGAIRQLPNEAESASILRTGGARTDTQHTSAWTMQPFHEWERKGKTNQCFETIGWKQPNLSEAPPLMSSTFRSNRIQEYKSHIPNLEKKRKRRRAWTKPWEWECSLTTGAATYKWLGYHCYNGINTSLYLRMNVRCRTMELPHPSSYPAYHPIAPLG